MLTCSSCWSNGAGKVINTSFTFTSSTWSYGSSSMLIPPLPSKLANIQKVVVRYSANSILDLIIYERLIVTYRIWVGDGNNPLRWRIWRTRFFLHWEELAVWFPCQAPQWRGMASSSSLLESCKSWRPSSCQRWRPSFCSSCRMSKTICGLSPLHKMQS